jgi:Sigma-70, region 4
MSRLDDLPPDQRAVLSLLVRQGKSHAEIAEMLGIPQQTVRDRARAALDALAQEPARPPAPGSDRQARTPEAGRPSQSPVAAPPAPARTRDTGNSAGSLPTSRRAGALLLAALVVIVVVVVLLITNSGGGSSSKATSTQTGSTSSATTTSPAATGTSKASSTSTTAGKPTLDKQIALTSPEPNSKTVGLVEVLSEGSKRAFYIAAEHLPPSSGFFYAVWLYNSPTSSAALGKIPPVSSNGQAQGGALLPANAGDYHEILLTRETDEHATKPGPVVLSGAFSLGGH